MSELLPCPFCGSKKIDPEGWTSMDVTAAPGMQHRHGPACDDCGASADSIERWNTRAQQAKPVVDDAMVSRFIGHGLPSGGWANTCVESVRRGLTAALSTGE